MSAAAFDLDRIGGYRAVDELIDEVLACGELALGHFRSGAQVTIKPDQSPVTAADQAVEKRLREFLTRRFPAVGFLGEETGAGATESALRFVVDPIDGTRAFIRGLPTWSILVALEAEGVPSLAIAFMPARGELFFGVRGGGAKCNGRPLRVSRVSRLGDAALSHGGLCQFVKAGMTGALESLARASSFQYGFTDFDGYRNVLLGRVEAMIDPGVAPWDVCPAAVLVREAGGRFTALDGSDTIHGPGGLATNGLVHDQLLALVHRATLSLRGPQ